MPFWRHCRSSSSPGRARHGKKKIFLLPFCLTSFTRIWRNKTPAITHLPPPFYPWIDSGGGGGHHHDVSPIFSYKNRGGPKRKKTKGDEREREHSRGEREERRERREEKTETEEKKKKTEEEGEEKKPPATAPPPPSPPSLHRQQHRHDSTAGNHPLPRLLLLLQLPSLFSCRTWINSRSATDERLVTVLMHSNQPI